MKRERWVDGRDEPSTESREKLIEKGGGERARGGERADSEGAPAGRGSIYKALYNIFI